MYYNTNKTHDPIGEFYRTANQNQLVLCVFRLHPAETLTAEEVHHHCRIMNGGSGKKDWPITSIRRAISTLTKQGKLTKTNELRKGKYGKNTYAWEYNILEDPVWGKKAREIRADINDTDTPGQGSDGF